MTTKANFQQYVFLIGDIAWLSRCTNRMVVTTIAVLHYGLLRSHKEYSIVVVSDGGMILRTVVVVVVIISIVIEYFHRCKR